MRGRSRHRSTTTGPMSATPSISGKRLVGGLKSKMSLPVVLHPTSTATTAAAPIGGSAFRFQRVSAAPSGIKTHVATQRVSRMIPPASATASHVLCAARTSASDPYESAVSEDRPVKEEMPMEVVVLPTIGRRLVSECERTVRGDHIYGHDSGCAKQGEGPQTETPSVRNEQHDGTSEGCDDASTGLCQE